VSEWRRCCVQSLGVSIARDRDTLKRHIKAFKTAIDAERKTRVKQQKERERLEKQARKKATSR